jgi:hypothetical protein
MQTAFPLTLRQQFRFNRANMETETGFQLGNQEHRITRLETQNRSVEAAVVSLTKSIEELRRDFANAIRPNTTAIIAAGSLVLAVAIFFAKSTTTPLNYQIEAIHQRDQDILARLAEIRTEQRTVSGEDRRRMEFYQDEIGLEILQGKLFPSALRGIGTAGGTNSAPWIR